jgi:hypothetical protein
MQNKDTIYIHQGPEGYLKLCEDAVGGRNPYGYLEHNGTLSGKGKLRYFSNRKDFVKSKDNKGHIGGVGYVGWVKFGNVEAAIDFLKQHYDVRMR